MKFFYFLIAAINPREKIINLSKVKISLKYKRLAEDREETRRGYGCISASRFHGVLLIHNVGPFTKDSW